MSARTTPCGDANCHLDRERKMIVVHPAENGRKAVFCDPCIAPMVRALNDAGIRTVASCCGHGFRVGTIALDDGRWLIIAKDEAERKKIDGLFRRDINGDPQGGRVSPPNKSDAEKVTKARELWVSGIKRKLIAAETGLSPRTVSRVCSDIPKPIEHRGRKATRPRDEGEDK